VPHFVVAAVGPDQPGIVAEFTRVFLEQDCNLEDSSMTVLRGQFAIMLVVEAPDSVTPTALESDLSFATSVFGLVISVWEIGSVGAGSPQGEPWTVSIYGADRRGIVHGITKLLADRDVNVVDLSTRLTGGPGEPVYSMILEVTLPPTCDPERLRAELEATAQALGVECSLHPEEAEIL
jgi:glycine cleavage system transcriptional repressor